MNYFYAKDPARPQGLVSREKLAQLLEHGAIDETTWVREENSAAWVLLVHATISTAAPVVEVAVEGPVPHRGNSVARDIGVGLFVTVLGGIVLALIQRPNEAHRTPVVIQSHVNTVSPTNDPSIQSQMATSEPSIHSQAAEVSDPVPAEGEPQSQRIEARPSASEAAAPDTFDDKIKRPPGASRLESQATTRVSTQRVASKSPFEVPSRLEPHFVDEYWNRELASSVRGHGRITPELHKNLVRAIDAAKQQKWDEAGRLWQVVVETSTCCGDYLNYNLAVARANAGDWGSAVDPLKTACGFGDIDRSGYALGIVYAQLGRWKDAAQVLRSVSVYGPYSRSAKLLLDHVEERLKEQWNSDSQR